MPCISQAARAARDLVIGAVEEQQQRVAAPLEQPGAPVVGLVEQRREHAIERVPHQLRADLALPRQPFRERGEPRDVDEDAAMPSTSRWSASGVVRSQSMTSRGTYGLRSSETVGSGRPVAAGALTLIATDSALEPSTTGPLHGTAP